MKRYTTAWADLVERFWRNVAVHYGNGCWLWLGARNKAGYGSLHRQIDGVRKAIRAHRLSYVIHRGEIPEGLELLHSSETPSCVNHTHLSPGTRKENMQDAAKKGRVCTIGKSRMTHCVRGHEFAKVRVRVNEKGHRRCIECEAIYSNQRYHAIRARSKP